MIVAIVSRQAYLRSAANVAEAEEEPARMLLIRCETMHDLLQNRRSSARMLTSGHALVAESLDLGERSIQPPSSTSPV
ncbi:hypothetical protein [Cupriavidus consociatus]|uniref:hypothetical protein n=1 Tax=Cupriavidus consociatus TaxID=2821357 RepID=UPI001FD751AF|nr:MULTISPECIES: hypothetical protein [unclassified Cupriavidus]MDK2657609.1 hypothetical protein [Cupriavidus sp. LEh21]